MRFPHKPRWWLLGLAFLAGCSASSVQVQEKSGSEFQAQLFEGMGHHRRTVTTSSDEAQRYFNQGLNWYYAFNHDEAVRSFRHAAELDPGCAMAWWGAALSEGPNYNDPVMTENRSAAAWEALQEAAARIDRTTPVERALIEALARRYAKPWPEDRSGLDKEYARAMAQVWETYPNDSDVGVLYAEAMMVLRPWQLYTADKEPAEDTPRIVRVLEQVLELDPLNPGANHLYIHAVEPSENPEQGLTAADRLCDMVAASGHLQHMPSHIYVQVGLWNQAVAQNEKAMASDTKYRALSPEQGFQYMYMTHNSHMLVFAAMMMGREKTAIEAARKMWKDIPAEKLKEVGPIIDPWMCAVYDVHKRFGRWEAILDEPAPPSFLPLTTAVWRSARTIAWASLKRFLEAEREYEAFRSALAQIPEDHLWFTDPAKKVLAVSDRFVAGEIALQKGNMNKAIQELQKAADLEDALTYSEPPQWLQPVRHALGAVYLKCERFEDAERVFREDLGKWPENGWSLYGLRRALEGQNKTQEAEEIDRRYRLAWSRADKPAETSCYCIPKT